MWHTLIISLVLVWYQHNYIIGNVCTVCHAHYTTTHYSCSAGSNTNCAHWAEVPSAPSISLYMSYKQPPPTQTVGYIQWTAYEGVRA